MQYFKGDDKNQQTIVTKISEGISKNASGLQHRTYVHVKPTWKDFANWDRYRPILPNCNDFTDTHPEKCLLRFLDMMKEAGYFGTDDEKFKISWQLVDDDKTSSSGVKTKKIRFSLQVLICSEGGYQRLILPHLHVYKKYIKIQI